MSKHTLGPWKVTQLPHGPRGGGGGIVVSGQDVNPVVILGEGPRNEANAHLIAAAPMMYEELARIYTEEGAALTPETCHRLRLLLAQVQKPTTSPSAKSWADLPDNMEGKR